MKARIYDPATCCFLSPDPYISDPEYATAYNKYAYCLNNPLSYVDPSGENPLLIAVIVGAVIGGASYTVSIAMSNGGFDNWNWGSFFKSVSFGAVSGAVTYGVGTAFGAVGSAGLIGEVGRAFAHGYGQAIITGISGGNFYSGFAAGSLSSLAGSAFMASGLSSNPISTYAFSGLAGGVGAELSGGDFWEGAAIGLMDAGLNHLTQGLQKTNDWNKMTDKQKIEIIMYALKEHNTTTLDHVDMRKIFKNYPKYGEGSHLGATVTIEGREIDVTINYAAYDDMSTFTPPKERQNLAKFYGVKIGTVIKKGYWGVLDFYEYTPTYKSQKTIHFSIQTHEVNFDFMKQFFNL